MTIEELKASGSIIFECISGSRAYGLETPTSDTDIRGVFVLPKEQYYSMNYIGQINNETNDIVYYELSKFIELCLKNNPNILELLNVPEKCVLYKHELFDQIKLETFLSKQCEKTFANYAYAQIKKAQGLEKKINNPVDKERKEVLDFCFVYENSKSIPVKQFLAEQKLSQENCGICSIPNMKDCYNLHYSIEIPYKGIVKNSDSNDISMNSIPKGEVSLGLLFFNKDGYSSYCKKYREYWDWVEKRNAERYQSTVSHGKNYDAKNMMHTFRLLHMAKEIALEKSVNVQRPDREFLLDIKNGVYEYDELVEWADERKLELEAHFESSKLQDRPDEREITDLLVQIRKDFYSGKA
jgi:hypothetical protein